MGTWPPILSGVNETVKTYPAAFFESLAERCPEATLLNEHHEQPDWTPGLPLHGEDLWDYTGVYPDVPMSTDLVTSGSVLTHTDEIVATGNDGKTYTLSFPCDPAYGGNDHVKPGTVIIEVTVDAITYIVTDDGSGHLVGDGSGTICYELLAPECHPWSVIPWLAHPFSQAKAYVIFSIDIPFGTSITATWEEDRTVLTSYTRLIHFGWVGHDLTVYDDDDEPIGTYEIDYISIPSPHDKIILVGQENILTRRFSIDPARTAFDCGFFNRMQGLVMELVPHYVDHTKPLGHPGDFTGEEEVIMFTLESFAEVAGMNYDPVDGIWPRVQVSGHTMTATYDSGTGNTTIHDSGAGFFRTGMQNHDIHIYGVGQFMIFEVVDANHVVIAGVNCTWSTLRQVTVLPWDWKDKDDVAFTLGLASSGDVRGPWLYYWLKVAILTLKWTLLWLKDSGPHDAFVHWDLAGAFEDCLHWHHEMDDLEYDIDFYISLSNEGAGVLERWDVECLTNVMGGEGFTGVQVNPDYIGWDRKRRAICKWHFDYT